MFLLCYKRIYILGMWAVENTFQIVVCQHCVWVLAKVNFDINFKILNYILIT